MVVLRIFKMIASCHHGSLKVHQSRFRPGSVSDPTGGAYSVPPDPLAGIRGPNSRWRGEEGEGKEKEEGPERKGKGGRDQPPPFANSWIRP